MPRLLPAIVTAALFASQAIAFPFYVREECFCQPSHPELASQYHNETLAACTAVAQKIQLSRAAARRLPMAPESWINEHSDIRLAEQPLNDNTAPYANAEARRKSAFEQALRDIAAQVSNKARHQHSAQTLPSRRNPRAPSVREQELKRRERRKAQEEEYKIICRGVIYQPSSASSLSTPSANEKMGKLIYIGFKPIPVLFIFLAMVLACTTIIEWGLEMWASYGARLRLQGSERQIYAACVEYADAGTDATMPDTPRTAALEKRAEAQLDSFLCHQ